MYRLAILVLLFLSPPLAADTETEIKVALDYFSEVWNENDMDAVASYFDSKFVLVTDDGLISRSAHLEGMNQISKEGGDRGALAYSNIVVQDLGEAHALAYGTVNLKFKDGSSLENWFSTVYVKTPFGWKALLTRN
jgi:hypothetical protein